MELQYQVLGEWIDCFETGPISLPSIAYLGFSAETGELHDNHDIIGVEAWNMHIRDTNEAAKAEARKSGKKNTASNATEGQQSRGWGWFFIKIVLFLVVIVGGYVGFTMYRASRRSSRF